MIVSLIPPKLSCKTFTCKLDALTWKILFLTNFFLTLKPKNEYIVKNVKTKLKVIEKLKMNNPVNKNIVIIK